MRRLALLLILLPTAACTNQYGHPEEFSWGFNKPATETTSARVERREIVAWGANPKDKRRLGFLYRNETKVVGSREYRDSYAIYDRLGTTQIGFITAEGVFYRFDKYGHFQQPPVYEGKIVVTGLKLFFDLPLTHNLDLEEIDPYK